MSQTSLRVLLDELTTARIICQHKRDDGKTCGTVVEVPIAELTKVHTCPRCQNSFQGEHSDDRNLSAFASAVKRTLASNERFKLEFDISQ